MDPEITVKFCNKCGYTAEFEELCNTLKENHADVKVKQEEGMPGSFEVSINNTLVHSKLSTLAFPDYKDISEIVSDVKLGKPVRKVSKQQPINSCIIV